MRFTQLLRLQCGQPGWSAVKQHYVPKHQPVLEEDRKKLEDFLINKPNMVVLTGAGISTESGNIFIFIRLVFHTKKFNTYICIC